MIINDKIRVADNNKTPRNQTSCFKLLRKAYDTIKLVIPVNKSNYKEWTPTQIFIRSCPSARQTCLSSVIRFARCGGYWPL